MLFRGLILALSVIISIPGFTQEDRLITAPGDTLYGDITLLLPSANYESIRMESQDGSKVELMAHEIRSCVIDRETYKTISYGGKYRIMKEVISGYLGKYLYRPDQNFEFGAEYLYKVTNEGMDLSPLFFKRSMTRFLDECPAIIRGIENKKYRYKNVEELIKDYNDICVEDSAE